MLVAAGLLPILGIVWVVSPLSLAQTVVAPETVSAARGKALFAGSEQMNGRIREHPDPMPLSVVACSNCHASHQQQQVNRSDAPTLSASFLTDRISRRHGPPSAYDNRSFCRVLRTGFDPAYVLVDHIMPVYDLSDSQCQSLWRFLQEPEASAISRKRPRS